MMAYRVEWSILKTFCALVATTLVSVLAISLSGCRDDPDSLSGVIFALTVDDVGAILRNIIDGLGL